MKIIAPLLLANSSLLSAIPVPAAETVTVSFAVLGVRSEAGVLKSVLCTAQDNFPGDCPIRQEVDAAQGVVNIEFQDVPPGEYAFAVFHDENANGQLDLSATFLPKEGMAFGKDAMGRTGVPTFRQSAITLHETGKHMVRMRYLSH